MKHPNLNTFAAWFFIPQTVGMAWVAGGGTLLLSALSVPAQEGDVPSRMVGALLLLLAVFVTWYLMRGLPPKGKPEGNGYALGHKLLVAGNVLAACLFVFQFFAAGIESHNLHLVLEKFTTAFGYLAMGCFAVGFSLIYQSALPQEEKQG
jgi:uncharacterized membrane protein HdeD (DUF308 family)